MQQPLTNRFYRAVRSVRTDERIPIVETKRSDFAIQTDGLRFLSYIATQASSQSLKPTTHHWVLFYVFKFIYKSLGNVHGRVWIAAAAAMEWVTSSSRSNGRRSRRAVLDMFHWDSTFRRNSCLFALFGGRLAISLLKFCSFLKNGRRINVT